MLPEPTLPKRRRSAPAQPQPGAMTPLFAVPDSPDIISPPGRQDAPAPARGRRPNSRPGGPGNPAKPCKEPSDLLTVTAERLRRALGRSFLRYGIPGDPDAAVHAAMNVTVHAAETTTQRLLRDHLPPLLTTAGEISAEWATWLSRPHVEIGRRGEAGPATA